MKKVIVGVTVKAGIIPLGFVAETVHQGKTEVLLAGVTAVDGLQLEPGAKRRARVFTQNAAYVVEEECGE